MDGVGRILNGLSGGLNVSLLKFDALKNEYSEFVTVCSVPVTLGFGRAGHPIRFLFFCFLYECELHLPVLD